MTDSGSRVELNGTQRAVLFALLTGPGEQTNRELRQRVGLGLTGRDRLGLKNAGLIESEMVGNAYVHTLSPAGADHCVAALDPGAGPAERVLFALIADLSEHLNSTDYVLAKAVRTILHGGSIQYDLETHIGTAYSQAADGRSESFIRLTELRPLLPRGLDRGAVDEALRQMYRDHKINLVPIADNASITADDRAAALDIGGEEKHRISMQRS